MNLVFIIVLVIITTFIYINRSTYRLKLIDNSPVCNCDEISSCFYQNFIDIDKSTKTKIFIHISRERNERNWENFGSRSTMEMNLDVTRLCIESVIKFCSNNYEVILYTNDDMSNLIPHDELCNIKSPELLAGVDLKQWENYCKLKILHHYGGVVMNPYFLFNQCPDDKLFNPTALTVCNINNEGISSSNLTTISTIGHMMSSPKSDNILGEYLKYFEYLCQNNYAEDKQLFESMVGKIEPVEYFSPAEIGSCDANGDPLCLEDIFSTRSIQLSISNFCIFVNIEKLKRSRKYGWILKMNKEQLKNTDMFFAHNIK